MRLYPAVDRGRWGDEMIATCRQLPPQRRGWPRAACFTSAKLRESWLGPFANAGKRWRVATLPGCGFEPGGLRGVPNSAFPRQPLYRGRSFWPALYRRFKPEKRFRHDSFGALDVAAGYRGRTGNVLCRTGLIGWAILFAIRRSGVHRLDDTSAERN